MKEENHAIWGPRLREVKKYEKKDKILKGHKKGTSEMAEWIYIILEIHQKKKVILFWPNLSKLLLKILNTGQDGIWPGPSPENFPDKWPRNMSW